MHRAHTHAEAQILGIAQGALNAPATAVVVDQLLGGGIGAAGGQTPGVLHVRVLNADHGSHRIAIGSDRGAAQHACASARSHPGGGGAGFAGGGGDGDVAAEADDVVEIQLLGQHPVEVLVAEATIGNNAPLDVGRQQFGEPHQHAMLVEAAVVLERVLIDGQPYQGCGAAVVGDQGQHDGGLFVGIEVGPVQCHHDGVACADDVGDPANKNIVDVDHRV